MVVSPKPDASHFCVSDGVRYAKESKVLFKVAGYVDAEAAKAGGGLVQLHNSDGSEADKEPASEQGSGDIHTGTGSETLSITVISKLQQCIKGAELLENEAAPKKCVWTAGS